MGKTDNLRLLDVRDVCRLIGECRDLGRCPALWHRRMLQGLARLFGVILAAGGEGWWERPNEDIRPVSAYSVSDAPRAEQAFRDYHQAGELGRDLIFRAIQVVPERLITRTRRGLVADRAWYGTPGAEYRQVGGINHVLTSVFQVTDAGAISVIALNRAIGEPDFSVREQRLLNFFHAELGRLIGGPLVSATEPGIEKLSPRLQETLVYLLQGDSEKQVAARLGLSTATVHQCVTALYRRFGVQSRAQLLVRILQRVPVQPGDDPHDGVPDADRALDSLIASAQGRSSTRS